jgi:hypothetical protein
MTELSAIIGQPATVVLANINATALAQLDDLVDLTLGVIEPVFLITRQIDTLPDVDPDSSRLLLPVW